MGPFYIGMVSERKLRNHQCITGKMLKAPDYAPFVQEFAGNEDRNNTVGHKERT